MNTSTVASTASTASTASKIIAQDTWPFKDVNDGLIRQFKFNGELFFRNFHNEIYSIYRDEVGNDHVANQWVGIYDPVHNKIDTFLRERIDGETLKEYRTYISLKKSEHKFQTKSDDYKACALEKQQLIEKHHQMLSNRQMKKSAKIAEKAEKKLADLRVKIAAKEQAKAKKLSESIQKEAARQLLKEAKAIQKQELMAQRAVEKRAEWKKRIAEHRIARQLKRTARMMERAVERKMMMQKREEQRQIQAVVKKEQDIENRPKLLEKLFVKGGITWQPLAFQVYMKWFPTAQFEPKENQNRFTRMNAFVNKMGHLFQPENSEALVEYMVQVNECI
jgi:multidrug efflux pump subunit AcrB